MYLCQINNYIPDRKSSIAKVSKRKILQVFRVFSWEMPLITSRGFRKEHFVAFRLEIPQIQCVLPLQDDSPAKPFLSSVFSYSSFC